MALTGCLGHPPVHQAAGAAQVLVVRRGWHVDVGLVAADVAGPLAFIHRQFPGARYVFFGFGDERYVRSHSHQVPELIAAVWPGRGVILVTAIDNVPAEAFGANHVVAIDITATQLTALVRFIADSFAPSAALPESGPYADSRYYAASAGYSGMHTCNTWAAEALQRGGLPVSSRGILMAGQLWAQVRPLSRAGAK